MLEIRPASRLDAEAAAPLIFSSGKEAFNFLFTRGGHHAVDFLRYSLQISGGFFGYGVHVVAVLNGKVAAAAAFYTRSQYTGMDLTTSFRALTYYGPLAVPAMIRDSARVKRLLPAPGKGTLYLGDLGVREDCRGRGIGGQILDFGRKKAEAAGLIYELDVSLNNPRAESLYKRYGFRVVAETETDHPLLPSSRRMQMTLSGK